MKTIDAENSKSKRIVNLVVGLGKLVMYIGFVAGPISFLYFAFYESDILMALGMLVSNIICGWFIYQITLLSRRVIMYVVDGPTYTT